MAKRRKKRVYLCEDDVEKLLDDLIAGETPKLLAEKYKIAHSTVTKHQRERLEVILRRKEFQKEFKF